MFRQEDNGGLMGLLNGIFGGQGGLLTQGQPQQGGLLNAPQNPMGGLLQGQPQQRPDFLSSLSRALTAAGQPSRYKKSTGQALLEGLSAGMNRNPEQFEMQAMLNDPDENAIKNRYMMAQMQASMRPELKSVKLGEKLVDPTTGKTVFDGGSANVWESVNDPMFGKGQKNKNTGEFKPVKTDVADPAKAEGIKAATLDVTKRLLNNLSGVKKNRGGISTLFPNISDEAVNAEADLGTLSSLLTTDNLGLLKGVLSDTDMQILKDIGAGGLKGADDQVIQNLRDIYAKLGGTGGAGGSNQPGISGAITGGKINYADPRVQKAFDAGYSEEQIKQYLGGGL